MRRQISETLHLGMLLAAVGGFLDAYTYLSRGKVFANAQTGNLVLLGIRAFEGIGRRRCTMSFPCARLCWVWCWPRASGSDGIAS